MATGTTRVPVHSLGGLRGQRVTVMGLGTKGGGLETAKFFARHRADVIVTDMKTEQELRPSLEALKGLPIRFVLGAHRDEDFLDADIVVPNPAVPSSSPYLQRAKAAGATIMTDIAFFFAFCPAPIAAITGTRGKTTTTTVAGLIMQQVDPAAVVAGNIQRSPLADLERITPRTPVILELSSWQLEGLEPFRRSPHWAVYTTLLQDHLNRYPSFDAYARAKETIFRYQSADDLLILPVDDERLVPLAQRAKGNVAWFGSLEQRLSGVPIQRDAQELPPGLYRRGDDVVLGGEHPEHVLAWSELGGRGDHTKRNMLAGAALAHAMGAPLSALREVLRTFTGVPHRLEVVRMLDGKTFVNDTTATTPEAVVAALHAFSDHRIVLITGGTDKELDYEVLAAALADARIAHLILLKGSATRKLQELLVRSRFERAPVVETMSAAVTEARQRALPGDVVLMSPGAASFELFRDEFDRGEQFRASVQALAPTYA